MADTQFSMFPKAPAEEEKEPSLASRLGSRMFERQQDMARLFGTLIGAMSSIFSPGAAARTVSVRVAIRQIFFTGVQALPLVGVIAVFVGAPTVIQVQLMAAALPTDFLGRILVAIILRELAPFATAVVVAGRSGTAMATELGNMKANSEILGLASVGIDPLRFIVFPRIVGTVVSVLALTVYFGAMALLASYALSQMMGSSSFSALSGAFSDALVPEDLALFLIKGTGLGTMVGWLCCHYGLEVQTSPTEVPQMASHAVVMTLVACVIFNTVVTAGFYWIVGPPVH